MNEDLKQSAMRMQLQQQTRRHFLSGSAAGFSSLWLASQSAMGSSAKIVPQLRQAIRSAPSRHRCQRSEANHFLAYDGAPSQLELFDYKPDLIKLDGKDCPQEFLAGKRFAFIQGTPKCLVRSTRSSSMAKW